MTEDAKAKVQDAPDTATEDTTTSDDDDASSCISGSPYLDNMFADIRKNFPDFAERRVMTMPIGAMLADILACDPESREQRFFLLRHDQGRESLLGIAPIDYKSTIERLHLAQRMLRTLIETIETNTGTAWRAMESAAQVLHDERTNVMQKRAAVVWCIDERQGYFPREVKPAWVSCPHCFRSTDESPCPYCSVPFELPDPLEYFEFERQAIITALRYELSQIAPQFENLSDEFITDNLASDREPKTIAAYFSCKVGAFGDHGEQWREVKPIMKRYDDAWRLVKVPDP